MDRDPYAAPQQSGHNHDHAAPPTVPPKQDAQQPSTPAENRGELPAEQVSGVVRGSGAGAGGGGAPEEYDSDSAGGSGSVVPSEDRGGGKGANAASHGSR